MKPRHKVRLRTNPAVARKADRTT